MQVTCLAWHCQSQEHDQHDQHDQHGQHLPR